MVNKHTKKAVLKTISAKFAKKINKNKVNNR